MARLHDAYGLALIATLAVALQVSAQQAPRGRVVPAATSSALPASSPSPARSAAAAASRPADSRSGRRGEGREADPGFGSAARAPARGAASGLPNRPRVRRLIRMRDLAEQIGRLEAEVRASHQQLQVLSQSVFSARAPGARAHISFTNDLSDAYRLQRALIVLDGAVQVRRRDSTGKLAARRQIPIFSGRISPGKHRLRVVLRLRGHGTGRFAYLSGQKFEVKSIHSFEVREGSSIDLTVNLWEMVGSGASLDQRPAVRYIETVQSGPRGRGLTGSSVGQTPAATGRGRRD